MNSEQHLQEVRASKYMVDEHVHIRQYLIFAYFHDVSSRSASMGSPHTRTQLTQASVGKPHADLYYTRHIGLADAINQQASSPRFVFWSATERPT